MKKQDIIKLIKESINIQVKSIKQQKYDWMSFNKNVNKIIKKTLISSQRLLKVDFE